MHHHFSRPDGRTCGLCYCSSVSQERGNIFTEAYPLKLKKLGYDASADANLLSPLARRTDTLIPHALTANNDLL